VTLIQYDRPFSAGQLASVLPGSLVFEYSVTQDELRAVRRGILDLGFRKGVKEEISEKRFRELMRQASPQVVDCIGSIAHERDHLRRLTSSSYGFLCDAIRCRIIRLLAEVVPNLGLQKFLKVNSATRGNFLSSLLFEGDFPRPQNCKNRKLTDIYELQLLLFSLTDANPGEGLQTALADLRMSSSRKKRGTRTVTRSASSRQTLITTRHILEMFAILEHGNALSRRFRDTSMVDELLSTASGEYRQLIDLWNSHFGEIKTPPMIEQPRGVGKSVFNWYLKFPLEFYVAADLALWLPFFPDQEYVVPESLSWHDVSPASRFVKALAYFEKTGLRPSPIPPNGRNQMFVDLQDAICREYAWPTPTALVSAWKMAIDDSLAQKSMLWSEMDGTGLVRAEMASQLLSLRQDHPCDFVLNDIDYPQLKTYRPLLWVFPNADGSRYPVPLRAGDQSVFLPFIMTEYSRHLIYQDSAVITPRYSGEFRRTAIRRFSTRLGEIGGWDDSLVTELESHLSSFAARIEGIGVPRR
jgi:hypothetical protein